VLIQQITKAVDTEQRTTNIRTLMRQENNRLILEVLKVASHDVLGQRNPLTVESPCRFSNAQGNLREVKDYTDIASTAENSATTFLAGLQTAST